MIIKRILTFYHVTPTKNIESIIKYGLDPKRAKPIELTPEEMTRYSKNNGGILMPKLPYYYDNSVIYLSTVNDDEGGYVKHYGSFSNTGGKMTTLEINIPKTEFDKIHCDNPKLMGAKNWKEYLKLMKEHTPERLAPKYSKGKTEKEIEEWARKDFEIETKLRVAVRGVIKPEWIKIIKNYDLNKI